MIKELQIKIMINNEEFVVIYEERGIRTDLNITDGLQFENCIELEMIDDSIDLVVEREDLWINRCYERNVQANLLLHGNLIFI